MLSQCRWGDPVPPEYAKHGIFAVVGEGPGEREVERGIPFVGPSGEELNRDLRSIGVERRDVHVFNGFACRPPNNELAKLEREMAKRNKEIARQIKAGEIPDDTPSWLHPVDACRPRLLRELQLAGVTDVIPVGAQALRAFTHERRSILDVRGGMMEGWMAALDGQHGHERFVEGRGLFKDEPPAPDAWRTRLLPTVHPAFVLRARRWTRVLRNDMHRAMRWFAGLNDWEPPVTFGGVGAADVTPSADWLYQWLLARDMAAWDTETDGLEPLLAKLRCVSLGGRALDARGEPIPGKYEAVLLPFLSVDGRSRFYEPAEEKRVVEVLRWWLGASSGRYKLGWNTCQYDHPVIWSNLGFWPDPESSIDGLTLHRVVDPELPHGLGFAVSLYGKLSPSWKASRTGKMAPDDKTLHPYALLDGSHTCDVVPKLVELVGHRQQQRVYAYDRKMAGYVAPGLHRIGLNVDRVRRDQHERMLLMGGTDPFDVEAVAAWETLGRPDGAWKWTGPSWQPWPRKMKGCPVKLVEGAPRLRNRRGAKFGSTEHPSYLSELQEYAGRSDFNPASVQQVREFLFETMCLPIPNGMNGKPKMTKGGDPSTDDEAVRALLVHPLVGGVCKCVEEGPRKWCVVCRPKRFLNAMRRYRESMKLWGTYIKRLVPMAVAMEPEAFDLENVVEVRGSGVSESEAVDALNREDYDEYEQAEKAAREIRGQHEKVKGYLWPDGRIRASFNAHGTLVGRLACSGPNLLNLPGLLRDMCIPGPGSTFVGADADQIHMRIIAARWGVSRYLRVFEMGGDPHAITADIIFGELFRNAHGFAAGEWVDGTVFVPASGAKWSGEAKKSRDVSKTEFYAWVYKAIVETQHRVITSAEDTEGNLVYGGLALEKVRWMSDQLLAGAPEIPVGWAMEIESYRRDGFLTEPVLGRRFDFLDGVGGSEHELQQLESKIVNSPILGAEASWMNIATTRFVERVPYDFAANTGLVHQNYDSMCCEVALDRDGDDPLRTAKHVASLMQECMTGQAEGLPGVTLTATAQVGPNLKEA